MEAVMIKQVAITSKVSNSTVYEDTVTTKDLERLERIATEVHLIMEQRGLECDLIEAWLEAEAKVDLAYRSQE